MNPLILSRRLFLLSAPLGLAACVNSTPPVLEPIIVSRSLSPDIYDEIDTEPFPVAAIDTSDLDPQFLRQRIAYDSRHPSGTIVIDPSAQFLYLVEGQGQATRYGVGVGREGFGWSGTARIGRKASWPNWTPPASMIKRKPELAQYASGMPGGVENPLGARALYLYQGNKDTLYRMHGTNEPESVGQAVSSGCIRLFNQDIIDLHRRVTVGATVIVLRHG
jgi:lipoprotein-anchoring transpeptidase ErfK/SrfK